MSLSSTNSTIPSPVIPSKRRRAAANQPFPQPPMDDSPSSANPGRIPKRGARARTTCPVAKARTGVKESSFIPTSDVSYDVGLKERSPWMFDAVSLSLARSKVAINPCSVIPQSILPLFTFQPSRTQETRTIRMLLIDK
ncbi:hypothetical protein BGY98DRAFT_1023079 [Russula aff. rugulosa BPL654]|nr:hypothetical protein BGY98DRAFT_1023079 [Russula aff. rugulosa BPL654]